MKLSGHTKPEVSFAAYTIQANAFISHIAAADPQVPTVEVLEQNRYLKAGGELGREVGVLQTGIQ